MRTSATCKAAVCSAAAAPGVLDPLDLAPPKPTQASHVIKGVQSARPFLQYHTADREARRFMELGGAIARPVLVAVATRCAARPAAAAGDWLRHAPPVQRAAYLRERVRVCARLRGCQSLSCVLSRAPQV